MNPDSMNKVLEAIKENDNFLVTAHMNPEGDSIGSQLAMRRVLERLGKKSVIVDQDSVPDNLTFLPGAKLIAKELPLGFKPGAVLVLDCPVLERVGKVVKYIEESHLVINIDHHVSNEFFGDINWVEPGISSAGEMLYGLVEKMGMDLDKDLATVIYAAIVTDTGMFNYSNTSSRTHIIAARLIEKGVEPSVIHSQIYEKKSASEIKLLGKALDTIEIDRDGKLAYMNLTRDMHIAGENEVSTAEFINYPRSIKGVEVSVFFKESDKPAGYINVSFRSSGRIDVNTVASRLGGGGHKCASGCLLKGNLEDVREKVLAEIRKVL